MSVPLRPDDPAYWILERGRKDPSFRSRPQVYRPGCYICDDDEFRLMGLPLCRPCQHCEVGMDMIPHPPLEGGCGKDPQGGIVDRGETPHPCIQPGHIPADDDECEDCGWSDNPNNPRHYVLAVEYISLT